jgi:hypothetical protein
LLLSRSATSERQDHGDRHRDDRELERDGQRLPRLLVADQLGVVVEAHESEWLDWVRFTLVNVNANVATIGMSVKRKNPMIQGAGRRSPPARLAAGQWRHPFAAQ